METAWGPGETVVRPRVEGEASGYCQYKKWTPNIPSPRSLCCHWGSEGCVGPWSSQVRCGDCHTAGAGADLFLHGEQW